MSSIDYGVDLDAGLVRVVARGSLVDEDVRECVDRATTDVSIRPGMDVIVDLCSARASRFIAPSVGDSLLVLREFGPLVVGNRMALVAEHGEAESRIFQRILEPHAAFVRLFDDLGDAEEWLRRDRDRRGPSWSRQDSAP